jgi:hypothetical protein
VFRAHADHLSYQTTAAFNYRDLYCWRHSIRPAMSSLSRSLFSHGWVRRHPLGHHDAGLHRQPGTHESEYRNLLHRAGLTLVKTTPAASQLSIFEAAPAQDEQR